METVNLLECLEASQALVDQAIPLVDMIRELGFADGDKPLPPPKQIKCPVFTL